MKKLILLVSLILVPMFLYAQIPDNTAGLVRLWHFNETSGSVANDIINFDTITWTGATTGVTGKYDKGVQTTAYTDYGLTSVANFMGLKALDECSVTFWIYPTEIPANGANGEVTVQGSATTGQITYQHNEGAGGRWYINLNGTPLNQYGTFLSSGVWQHITITFKRNDYLYLYINGTQKESEAMPNTATYNSSVVTYILNNQNQLYGGKAIYDDWANWNKALSQSEITQIYTNAWTTPPTYKQNTRIVIH